MIPYKRFREVIEDDKGKRIPLATVTVYNADDTLAVLYADRDGTGGSTGSQVQSDTKGEVSFYADDGQYKLVIAKTGFLSIIVRDVTVGGGGINADDFPEINLAKAPYNIKPGIPDAWEEMQAAHDESRQRYGSARLKLPRFKVPIGRGIMGYDVVDIEGPHKTESGFLILPGFIGAAWYTSQPTIGRTVGRVIQLLRSMRFDGDGVGRQTGSGIATNGLDVLLKCTFTNGPPPAGSMIEFVGADDPVKVLGWVLESDGTYTVTLDKEALYTNSLDGVAKGALRWRPTKALVCSSTAGSATLTVAAGDRAKLTADIEGWRVSGTALDGGEGDEDPGLRTFTRITTFNATTGALVIDDPAANTSASFVLTAWCEPASVLFASPKNLAGYNDNKEYAGCDIQQVTVRSGPGMGFQGRPGRHQLRFSDSKADQVDRAAYHFGGCNDTALIQCGGTSWNSCYTFRSGATPKCLKSEFFLPGRVDTAYAFVYGAVREANVSECDFNGPISVTTHPDETKPSVVFTGCNAKWFRSNTAADPAQNQHHVKINRGVLQWIGGTIKEAQTGKPQYLQSGTGTLAISKLSMVTDLADPRCPYELGMVDPATPGTVLLDIVNPDRKQVTMGDGSWQPTLSCVTNPGSLAVTYSDRRGYWSVLPGGRVLLTIQLTGIVNSVGAPAAAGNLRLDLPPGIAPRAGYGGQRIAASVEGAGVALGADFIVNAVKVAEGGSIAIWKTGPGKTPTEAAVGNFPVGQEFTLSVFGELLV